MPKTSGITCLSKYQGETDLEDHLEIPANILKPSLLTKISYLWRNTWRPDTLRRREKGKNCDRVKICLNKTILTKKRERERASF